MLESAAGIKESQSGISEPGKYRLQLSIGKERFTDREKDSSEITPKDQKLQD